MRGIAVAVAVLAVPEYETAVAVKKSYHFSESRTAFPKVVGLFGENSYLVAVLAVLLVVLAVPAVVSATPVVVSAPVEALWKQCETSAHTRNVQNPFK